MVTLLNYQEHHGTLNERTLFSSHGNERFCLMGERLSGGRPIWGGFGASACKGFPQDYTKFAKTFNHKTHRTQQANGHCCSGAQNLNILDEKVNQIYRIREAGQWYKRFPGQYLVYHTWKNIQYLFIKYVRTYYT